MVRPELVRAFEDACFADMGEELAELQRTFLQIANYQSGVGRSSNLLHAIDGTAAKSCSKTVESIYGHLLQVVGAEPPDGSNARAEELADLLIAQINLAGRQFRERRDAAFEQYGKGFGIDWAAQLTQMPEALDLARMRFASKVRTVALGSVNRGGYSLSHTVNVHGPVGAVQSCGLSRVACATAFGAFFESLAVRTVASRGPKRSDAVPGAQARKRWSGSHRSRQVDGQKQRKMGFKLDGVANPPWKTR
jgi:hypothetical protein